MRCYTKIRKLIILRELDEVKSNEDVQRLIAFHNISTEEIADWRKRFEHSGMDGLKVKNCRQKLTKINQKRVVKQSTEVNLYELLGIDRKWCGKKDNLAIPKALRAISLSRMRLKQS